MNRIGQARTRLFGIGSPEAVFSRPGFAPEAWQRFSPVATSLMEGYHATLEESDLDVIEARLEAVDPPFQGFAYEGAGMGLAALDVVAPWKERLREFVEGPGAHHAYPIYVGVGLAYARLRRTPESYLGRLDPLLGWVTADGYGFHEVFFKRRRYVEQHKVPTHLSAYGRRVFDQGVGRALWFSLGAGAEQVTSTIARFQPHRHGDLWSGVGLAASYGGGADVDSLRAVLESAGPHATRLARGAATAAWGRQQAGNPTSHTDLACQVFCSRSDEQAANVVDQARYALPTISVEPRYETWRRRIEEELQKPHPPAQFEQDTNLPGAVEKEIHHV